MRGGKVPSRLVLVVLGFVVMGVIGFQAISERVKLNATYRLLEQKDEQNEKLRLRLTSAVEKHSTEVGRLTDDNLKLSSEKYELRQQLTDLGLTAQRLRQKLEKQAQLKEKEIRSLKLLHKSKLEDKESTVTALSDKLRKREKEVEVVKSEVVTGREKKEKELSALQEKNVALASEIEKLHEELERLKGSENNLPEGLKEVVAESTNRTSTVADEVSATKPKKKSWASQIFGHADTEDSEEEGQLAKGSNFSDDGKDTGKQDDAEQENNGEQGEESYADERSDLESDKEQDDKPNDDDGEEAGEEAGEEVVEKRPKADEEEAGFDDRDDSDLLENTE